MGTDHGLEHQTEPMPDQTENETSERQVLRMGDPRLRVVAEPVRDFGSPRLLAFIEEMWMLMARYGGIGLAAPQVGVSERIIVFGMDAHPRFAELAPVPRTVLINPLITPIDTERVYGWEGCLSVPGMRGYVPRYHRIRYQGQDTHGNAVDQTVEGYHARVVQHECDHLDGILYPQRMDDLTTFGFDEEISAALNPCEAGEVLLDQHR